MIGYCFKTTICAAIFILFYKLLLEKEKMLLFNRYYLLVSLIASFIIPLITFQVANKEALQPLIYRSAILVNSNKPGIYAGEMNSKSIDIASIIKTSYIIITLCLLARFIRNFFQIVQSVSKYKKVRLKNAKLVLQDDSCIAHSFLHFIFINKTAYKEGLIEKEILEHELAHVQQKHTCDLLLTELIQCFAWFNFPILLYRKAIRLNHEFLADAAVLKTCQDATAYQYLLIRNSSNTTSPQLYSNFNFLITKKRLLMMTRTTSPAIAFIKQCVVLPLFAGAILLLSNKTFAQKEVPAVTKAQEKEIPFTSEGVSDEVLKEYTSLVTKYKTVNSKGYITYNKIEESDKERMVSIYKKMNKDQQNSQAIQFYPVQLPPPAQTPTADQLKLWVNEKIYGVWIDGKRIKNSSLANYQAGDFGDYFASRLMKNAINYGNHYVQVNLRTKAQYEQDYKITAEEVKNGEVHMMFKFAKAK